MPGKGLSVARLSSRTEDLMTAHPHTAHPDQTLSHLVNRVFLQRGISFAPVVELDVLLGYVDVQMVRRIDRENWATTTVEDVVEPVSDENTVLADVSALDLLLRILTAGRHKFLVVDDGGDLVGVVTLSDVLKVLQVPQETNAPDDQRGSKYGHI